MSSIRSRSLSVELPKVACLVLATGALLWLLQASVLAQSLPGEATAQNPGTQVSSQMKQLFVNPTNGNDSQGGGSDRAPFKTITQALQVAEPNTVIVLAPGTYSAKTGETFPLRLKPGIIIQGDPSTRGRGVTIQGGGQFLSPTFARQNATILAADDSALTGVTVTNPNPRGYGLWIESSSLVVANNTFMGSSHDGIAVAGESVALIRDNYFSENGADGIATYGTSRPEIRDNVFERTGFGLNIAQNSAPVLIGNRILQNKDGVVAQNNSRPVLRNNQIERNQRDGLVAIANAIPDLGTTAESGGNVLRNNGRFEINATAAKQIIPAYGNQVANNRTSGRIDFSGRANPGNVGVQVASNPRGSRSPVFQSVEETKPLPLLPPSSSQTSAAPSFPTATNGRSVQRAGGITLPQPNSPINIPVPPAPTASSRPVPPPPPATPPASQNRGDTLPTLLPVPNPNAPIGDAGDAAPAIVPPNTRSTNGSSPPPPPSRAASMGFRYRVIVETSNERQQDRIRSLVPDAFPTTLNDEEVMQVGVFKTQDKVNALVQLLQKNGFTPTVLDVQ